MSDIFFIEILIFVLNFWSGVKMPSSTSNYSYCNENCYFLLDSFDGPSAVDVMNGNSNVIQTEVI
jgi:hypothetical protein